MAGLALITVSCGGQATPRDLGDDEQREAGASAFPDSIDCDRLADTLMAVYPRSGELRRTYGAADSITVALEPNRHIENASDSTFGVYYPGLIVHLRKPPGGRELVERVQVSANRYLRYPRLGIGATEAQVVSTLGEPTDRRSDELVYACGTVVEQPVAFVMSAGLVRWITIQFYVD